MYPPRRVLTVVLTVVASAILVATGVPAQTPHAESTAVRNLDEVLLIPHTGIDAIMAFDPQTGDLIDAGFISDPERLNEPVNVILNFDGDGVFVSDRLAHVVHEYDLEGNFVRTFAPAGGQNVDLMRDIRAIRIDPTGTRLWVSMAGPSTHVNRGAILEFDTEGNYLGNLVGPDDSPIDRPWGMLLRDDDMLVASSTPNGVFRFELDGELDGLWNQQSVNFPHQLAAAANGNILVAGFSNPSGVHEFEADGTFVALYDVLTSLRGIYELPNGNFLVTNSGGLHEVSRANEHVRTIVTGQMRHIERVVIAQPAPPQAAVEPEELFFWPYVDTSESQPVTLSNTAPGGADALTFSIWFEERTPLDMISVEPAEGSVEAGAAEELTVTVDAEGVEPGVYTFDMLIETNDPEQPQLIIPVYVEVFTLDSEPGAGAGGLTLEQNSPNPFAGRTEIGFTLPEPGPVRIDVFDATGRLVATLLDHDLPNGRHTIVWERHDLVPGVYLYRIQAGDSTVTRRAVVVR